MGSAAILIRETAEDNLSAILVGVLKGFIEFVSCWFSFGSQVNIYSKP